MTLLILAKGTLEENQTWVRLVTCKVDTRKKGQGAGDTSLNELFNFVVTFTFKKSTRMQRKPLIETNESNYISNEYITTLNRG